MYWGIVCPLYGISLFLPTIIKQLGYTSTTAQLLTIPIYCTAAVLAIIVCWCSDKAAKRGASRWPYVFFPMLAILIGFIMAISGSAHGGVPGVVYAGVFIATCGIYPAFPGNITWISNNLAGSYKRAAGSTYWGSPFSYFSLSWDSNFSRDMSYPSLQIYLMNNN